MGRTIREVQQDFANSCGYRNEVIWDFLAEDKDEYLKTKIKQLIRGQPKNTKNEKQNDDDDDDNDEANTPGQAAINRMRETLFENIWAQRKYTNRNSLTAIIYILVTKETDFNKVTDSKQFSCHPVFRARKCVADDDSSKCCMVFIDEVGRVYSNWDAYVKENVLPKGTMVAPHRGIYNFDEHNRVKLDIYETPASSIANTALAVADTTSAVAGFASAGVPIAALLTIPVAAPLMAGAAFVGMAAAAYSTIRSGSNLIERNQHSQSISIADRQARGSWLGVAAGFIGFGASGATRAMTTAATAGREISLVTELAVNGMNISSIVLSGTGVANGVLDLVLKYKDDEDITLLDIVQLSASLVLFTHSVSNFQMASKLVSQSRNGTFQNYRENLSNRQRRMFDKMSKETMRVRGETRGKIDIIRNINEMPSKQYLNDLYKINRNLNQENVRPAFAGAGESGVVLNNDLKVDTSVLRSSVQHNVGPNVLNNVNQPIPQSYKQSDGRASSVVSTQTRLLFANPTSYNETNNGLNLSNLAPGVRAFSYCSILIAGNIKIALSEFGERIFENIMDAESFQDVINFMAEKFPEEVFRFIMNLTRTFIETMLDDIRAVIQTVISTEAILFRILTYCLERYENRTYEFLQAKTCEILKAVQDYFNSMNPNNHPDLLKACTSCGGFFGVCNL